MDDLISRQDAIDAFMTSTSDGDKAEWCKWVLEQLPYAQPERKKGEWIDDGFQEEWWGEQFTCSICGGTMIGISKYCPECGAEMREETK